MPQTIIVLDFGSQYTQVIARRIREANVYSKVLPFDTSITEIRKLEPVGIVLSGGPASVLTKGAPKPKSAIFGLGVPVLGICYGLQLMGKLLGGGVEKSQRREYGRSELKVMTKSFLFRGLPSKLTVWNSHGDCLTTLPKGFRALAQTENSNFSAIEDRSQEKILWLAVSSGSRAFRKGNRNFEKFPLWSLQVQGGLGYGRLHGCRHPPNTGDGRREKGNFGFEWRG